PRESWHLIRETADAFNADTKFVAIAGYEWSSQPGYWAENANGASTALFAGKPRHYNHKNVYFPSRVEYLFSARDSNYNSPDLLAAAVAKVGGLIHNNHPSDDEPDQFHYTAEHAAIIANTELWPDVGFDKGKRYTPNTVQTVRKFLDRGGRTGFVGGSDSHDGKPYARTAVFATNLTRAGIF